MPKVGRPPLLRVRHQRREILLQRRVVEVVEFLLVVEVLAHRIRLRGVLMEQLDPQLLRPPVAIRPAGSQGSAMFERALGFGRHTELSFYRVSLARMHGAVIRRLRDRRQSLLMPPSRKGSSAHDLRAASSISSVGPLSTV